MAFQMANLSRLLGGDAKAGRMLAAPSRVEEGRGGGRIGLSVSAPLVWRCLNGRAITPFPLPAHRTGRADFRHPALRLASPQGTRRTAKLGWCLATTPWHVTNLRLAAELPRKPPDALWCCQAHRQSPILSLFESVPEVRVLSSAGVTRPHRSYDPVRLPPGPPCLPRRWSCDLRPERVSPDYPDHLPNVPCPLPRWIGTGACVGCFPIPRGLPRQTGGSASTISLIQGLLRLHSRYGPLGRPTAQSGLCHEASRRSVTRPPRSSATRSTDNSLGGSFLHWCSAPSGRTVRYWLRLCENAAAQSFCATIESGR